MSPSVVKTTIGEPFNELTSVNSTNIYAMNQLQANLAAHGTAFFAHEQTAGKGQRGKQWQAETGQNIVLSVVVDTSCLAIYQQFFLSAAVAVACYEFLLQYIPNDLSIKWPNDLYWCDRKAGGILIENVIAGNNWKWAVIGIGLNINQTIFTDLTNKAVSIKQITGKHFNPVELAQKLCAILNDYYTQLKLGNGLQIIEKYNNSLYKKGEKVLFKKNNAVGVYTIQSVNAQGELVVQSAIEETFNHGTVEWII